MLTFLFLFLFLLMLVIVTVLLCIAVAAVALTEQYDVIRCDGMMKRQKKSSSLK